MFIPFVKTIGGGAKWIKFAKLTDIDKPKYNETMKKVFEPLLDVLQMNYDEVASIDRQSRLDAIFEQNI
jgi:hypothetical protein